MNLSRRTEQEGFNHTLSGDNIDGGSQTVRFFSLTPFEYVFFFQTFCRRLGGGGPWEKQKTNNKKPNKKSGRYVLDGKERRVWFRRTAVIIVNSAERVRQLAAFD